LAQGPPSKSLRKPSDFHPTGLVFTANSATFALFRKNGVVFHCEDVRLDVPGGIAGKGTKLIATAIDLLRRLGGPQFL
jgi:hypothetical protein